MIKNHKEFYKIAKQNKVRVNILLPNHNSPHYKSLILLQGLSD